MLKKFFALFKRKKEAAPHKPERLPTNGPVARKAIPRSQARSQTSSDNSGSLIYVDTVDCSRSSHDSSHCSGSSWGGSDSGGYSSSSDCGSSSSSSCD